MKHYILDGNGEVWTTESLEVWSRAMQTMDRRVALDQVGPYRVSTVFLAMDHSFGYGEPVLWETMVFGPSTSDEDWRDEVADYTQRYTSKEDAVKGHNETVAAIKELVNNE